MKCWRSAACVACGPMLRLAASEPRGSHLTAGCARRHSGSQLRPPQDGRAAELAAELAALGLPKAALGDALARRYVRGTWAPSAADAAARLTRRRFLAALPGCAGALRLAACEWACEELGDQAVADRRMAAVEAAAELEALQEWAQRCGSAAAALAAPGLPAGMHAEVAELFTRSAAA